MAPTASDIVMGMAFVAVGLLKACCDRWQLETKAEGRKTIHTFNHLIILIFMEQFFQMFFLLFYNAMDKNWLGMGCLYHGDLNQRDNADDLFGPTPVDNDDDNDDDDRPLQNPVAINIDDDDQRPLIQPQDDPAPVQVDPDPNAVAGVVVDGDPDPDDYDEDEDYEEPRRRKPSRLLYLIPGWLWVFQTLLVHFGLDLTYGSSFIMLKGSMTLFTALLGVAFLAQQLFCHVWLGIWLSCAGFAIAGLSDYLKKPEGGYEKYGVASGDLLIVMAQICIACKQIYEEKYLRKHSLHPMKFLGGEGIYGFILALALLIVFSFVKIADYYSYVIPKTQHLEDIYDAAVQLGHSWELIIAFIGSILLHLLWNYLGMIMVRNHGALPKIMIETLVWMFYWVVCLGLSWENFYVGQVPGLCVIAVGLLFYGNILPLFAVCEPRVPDINLNRMYLNREHFRYEPIDGRVEENQQENPGDNVGDPNTSVQAVHDVANGGIPNGGAVPKAQHTGSKGSDRQSPDADHTRLKDRSGASNVVDGNDSSSDDDSAVARGGASNAGFAKSSSDEEDENALAGRHKGPARHSFVPESDDDEPLTSFDPSSQDFSSRQDDSSSNGSGGFRSRDDDRLLQA